MSRLARLGLRLFVALVALVLAFLIGEWVFGLLRGEELTLETVHVRYRQYFRGPDGEETEAPAALAKGWMQPVAAAELIAARELALEIRPQFHADGWIRWEGPAMAKSPWIDKAGLEQIRIRGSARNDGEYWALAIDGDHAIQVERPLVPETATAPVSIHGLRPRFRWSPGVTWWICYTGLTGTERADYFDDRGCVEVRMNAAGIRDREEVAQPKPVGQRRIVCVGDSFTFAWGVKFEDGWTQLVERQLRRRDDGIRTLNCGAAGAMLVDEYVAALEHRFFAFEPDAVILTVCLNDLLPTTHALAHQSPLPWLLQRSRILRSLLQSYALSATLHIDPDRDLVGELLALPESDYPIFARAEPPNSIGRAALWAGGGPQRALERAMGLCADRGVKFGVVVWPLFQGLGRGEHYPFARMHRELTDYCGSIGVPVLDLLPTFAGQVETTAELWICPADYHGNERAQRMAEPALTDFATLLLR
jgi:hypothetical protein